MNAYHKPAQIDQDPQTFGHVYSLTAMLGSFADIPRDLKQEIAHLEKLFGTDTAKLKQITDHFVKELEKGEVHECLLAS